MALDVSSIRTSSPAPIDGSRRAPVPQEIASDSLGPILAGAVKPPAEVPNDLKTAIRDLQRVSETFNRRLSFSLNEKLGEVVVKVIDNDTDKVVREIPPAELQRVYERIREVIGLLFDKSA
jgi:flagellar protein FlaG